MLLQLLGFVLYMMPRWHTRTTTQSDLRLLSAWRFTTDSGSIRLQVYDFAFSVDEVSTQGVAAAP
jgi:hypothetical protein